MDEQLKQRIMHAYRLYLEGLTLVEIGKRLDPPRSGKRVGQYMKIGAEAGLFDRPRRGAPAVITEDLVRKTMRATGSRTRCSQILKIDHKSLEARFGRVLDEIAAELRTEKLERKRREALSEYLRLSKRLGYFPSSTELGSSPLMGRIVRAYGRLTSFFKENRIEPKRVRRRT